MSHAAAAFADDPPSLTTGVPNLKLGMWVFLASEVMFFTGMIGGYIVLRLGSSGWPDPNEELGLVVLAVNTFILICSSVTFVLGLQAIQQGDSKKLARFLLITALLGLTFLVIKIADYSHLVHLGNKPSSGLFWSCYYTLTGFHGLHVLGGVVTLVVMWVRTLRGHFSADNWETIEVAGLYWHFVDLVWIVLFAILCLV